DREIGLERGARELHQADAIVEQRPQRRVGEVVVEALELRWRQVEDRELHLALARGLCRRRRRFRQLAAPAEPQAAAAPQRLADRNGKAAGALDPLSWQDDAVGDDDQAAHEATSQLTLSLMAELMRPTRE